MTRRLAWQGVAFRVPDNWELALHRNAPGGAHHIEIEDACAVRLELDWTFSRKERRTARFRAGHRKLSKQFTARATSKTRVPDLPEGWQATHYVFRETLPTRRRDRHLSVVSHDLVHATYAAPDGSILATATIHVLPDDPEDPVELTHIVTAGFECRHDPLRWQAFDIAFELPARFQLEGTSFDIGSKLLVFRAGRRRLYRWFLSCADRFLTPETNATEWVVAFLNGQRRVPGIVFLPAADGTVTWRRRRPHVLCHRDELSRWCFRYRVTFERDTERNQLRITVFNYREPGDLRWLSPT